MKCLGLSVLLFAVLEARADDTITCPAKGCGCEYRVNNETKGLIDLTKLSSTDPLHPRFNASDTSTGYYYLVNFCNPISSGGCTTKDETAVCQHGDGEQGATYPCGRLDQRSFFINNSVVQVVYKNNPGDTNTRETHITLKCNAKQDSAKMTFQTEGPGGYYWIDLEYKDFCMDQPASSVLSPGSIILICAVIILFIYLVAGMIIKRVRKGVTGVEMIPNRDFWMEIPGYIKDGACLLCSPCRRGADYEKL